MKKAKKWIWIAVAAVVVIGGVAAAVVLSRNNREPVYVYGFADGMAGMTDYYDGGNESSGMVTTDRIQTAFLSETQKVLDILVTDGQQVKKGDVLFTYDTTLSDIALRQKELSVEQAKLDLETAKKELAVINSYVPISHHEVVQPEPTEPAEPVANLADFDLEGKDFLAYSGSGSTALTPRYCWLRSSAMVDENMMALLFADTKENVLFVRFQHTEDDKNDGAVTEEYGIKLMRLSIAEEDGSTSFVYRFSFFDLNAGSGNDAPIDDGIDWNSGYTAAEIAAMRAEKQAQIKDQKFQIKVAEAEFKIMQKEADSGQVVAEFDGTVVGLTDPETAVANNQPLLKVSGGGGFYVEGAVSELQLNSIRVGQKVSVMSWDTYETYEGTIVEIQHFPDESENGGSQNVSYYPYKVFIDESANLQDGYYVSMTLQGAEDQTSLYIQNPFVRTEGARSYVYVRGEDGRLEKRYIQTGANLWGSYTQVLGGLTADDYVAFPYGKTVKEGAPTQEGTPDNLYANY